MLSGFDIPVVLIIFKRTDTVLRIIERLREVRPQKIYIISDAGRNDSENIMVENCRQEIENSINWDCEIIKNYATTNRGVHAQIGLGARWVFEREETAIFLEDDNLPEVTFFDYCKKCLLKYKDNEDIFWICGTNYLQKCKPKNNASVFASRHLMPCGWASWSNKFLKYYDFNLELTDTVSWEKDLKKHYKDKRLYKQQLRSISGELKRKELNQRYASWDFHTVLSIRMRDLYGIVPKYNQIENIGVDEFSTHGGNSMEIEMTRRFCGIKSFPLSESIILPSASELDFSFEKDIGKIILYPLKARIILHLRDLFKVKEGVRLRDALLHKNA